MDFSCLCQVIYKYHGNAGCCCQFTPLLYNWPRQDVMFSRVMLIIYFAYKSPGEYGNMQILIQQTWGGTWDFAFHASSQEMLFSGLWITVLYDKTWGIIFGPLLRSHNLPKQLIHWYEFKYICMFLICYSLLRFQLF